MAAEGEDEAEGSNAGTQSSLHVCLDGSCCLAAKPANEDCREMTRSQCQQKPSYIQFVPINSHCRMV